MKQFIFVICLLVTGDLFAQSPQDLDPVTITSTRTPRKVSETGRSITVLDGKLFGQLPVHSLDELLKFAPGVEVQSRGPMGAQSDIVIRGGTFQQVLVLIDGIKLNDPVTGHFSAYIPVAPYEIERIEVLRGPAAALYGAEAVGGVINIITKIFDKFSREKKLRGAASVSAGEYGLLNGSAGIRKTGKRMNAAMGLLTNNTSGQLLRGSNRGYLHNHTLSGSAAFTMKNNWQLSLRTSVDDRDFAAQNFYTTFKTDTAVERVTTSWNQVQLRQQKGHSSNQLDLVYKATRDHYLFNPTSVANENRSGNLVLQFIHTQQHGKYFTSSQGIQIDRRSIRSNDRGDHSTNHGAVFGSLLYNYSNWNISPGLRLDWDQNYGAALLPQVNASYRFKYLTIRANAGRAIRGADFTERYNNYNKAVVSSGTIGNPQLGTENSWSYEAGADLWIKNYFKASASVFYRDQEDVIDFVTTTYADMPRKENLVPGGVYALAKNIKDVSTRGIEMELTYQRVFPGDQALLVIAGLSFLRSATGEQVPSFYIVSHAGTLLQSNLVYRFRRITLATNWVYKHRSPREAATIEAFLPNNYFLWNGRLSVEFLKHLSGFISVNNITDTRYSDLLGSIMPRRWTTAGVSIDF